MLVGLSAEAVLITEQMWRQGQQVQHGQHPDSYIRRSLQSLCIEVFETLVKGRNRGGFSAVRF